MDFIAVNWGMEAEGGAEEGGWSSPHLAAQGEAGDGSTAMASDGATFHPRTPSDLRPYFLALVGKLTAAFSEASINHEVQMGVPLSADKALAAAAAAAAASGGGGTAPSASSLPQTIPPALPWSTLSTALATLLHLTIADNAPSTRRGSTSIAPYTGAAAGDATLFSGGGGAPHPPPSLYDLGFVREDSTAAHQALEAVSALREGTRASALKSWVSAAFTTHLRLTAQRGKALFFEVTVRNPLDFGDYFEAHIAAPPGELRVVTSAGEWEWLRGVCTPAVGDPGWAAVGGASSSARAPLLPMHWEEGVGGGKAAQQQHHHLLGAPANGPPPPAAPAAAAAAAALPRVFLHPGQSLTLPIVYHCLSMATAQAPPSSQHPTPGLELISPPLPPTAAAAAAAHSSSGSTHQQRSVTLTLLSASTHHPAAHIEATITLLPAPISRTVRYTCSEEGWVRGALPLPPPPPSTALHSVAREAGGLALALGAAQRGGGGGYIVLPPDETTLACSIVEGGGVGGGRARRELCFRTRAAAAPATAVFHVLLFDDPWRTILRGVWRIAISSVLACEGPTCTPGQDAHLELLLRGGSASGSGSGSGGQRTGSLRLITDAALPGSGGGGGCGVSLLHPPPSLALPLAPRAQVHRLHMAVCPRLPGPRRETLLVHGVGEGGVLVAAWRVGIHVCAPSISRVFDVALPGSSSSSGSGSSGSSGAMLRRLEYGNEWDAQRHITLRSSHPDLVALRTLTVALPPRGRGVIQLAVAPAPAGVQQDVYLYVRDESGAVEETLLLRLAWT